jgi:DNA-binding transcriptional LysR family regulator
MIEVHHLRVFVAVFRRRSFTAASQELHLSQPTISGHIKALEEELGVRLFDRLGRKVAPTEKAEALYAKAQQLLQGLEGLKEAIRPAAEPSGELLLGASTIPGTYLLPRAAAAFRKLYPQVRLTVLMGDSTEVLRKVLQEELPLAVVGKAPKDRRLRITPAGRDELVLATRADLWPKRAIGPEELKRLPFVAREEGSGTRAVMEEFFRRHLSLAPQELNVVATLGSTAAVKEALKAGLGASVLSRQAIQEELHRGLLRGVSIRGLPRMHRNFYLVHLSRRSLPALAEAFLQFFNRFFL